MSLLKMICLFASLSIGMFAFAQSEKLAPPTVDFSQHPGLESFLSQLNLAIEQEDLDALFAFLSDDVMSSFGGDGGREEFYQFWDGEQYKLWWTLRRIIDLGGCSLDQNTYAFPYVFNLDLEDGDAVFSIGAVTGERVNLRSYPTVQHSEVIAQLSHELVWFLPNEYGSHIGSGDNEIGEPLWLLVQTYDRKQQGWIYWKYVYSPIDYRMIILYNKEAARWEITALVAGD